MARTPAYAAISRDGPALPEKDYTAMKPTIGLADWLKVNTALNEALYKAQADIQDPVHDQDGVSESGEPYTYASLSSILSAIRAAFTPHGLSLVQPVFSLYTPERRLWGVKVTTTIRHIEGGSISEPLVVPVLESVNPLAELGKAITYGRRYGASALCGIASDKDSDAQRARRDAVRTVRTTSVEPPSLSLNMPAANDAPTDNQEATAAAGVQSIEAAPTLDELRARFDEIYPTVRGYGFQALTNDVLRAKSQREKELAVQPKRKARRK